MGQIGRSMRVKVDSPWRLNWRVRTGESGRSCIKIVQKTKYEWSWGTERDRSVLWPSTFYLRDPPLIVELPSTLAQRTIYYRPGLSTLMHLTVQVRWLSSPKTVTLARPSNLRTFHFHPFGPFTLDLTRILRWVTGLAWSLNSSRLNPNPFCSSNSVANRENWNLTISFPLLLIAKFLKLAIPI